MVCLAKQNALGLLNTQPAVLTTTSPLDGEKYVKSVRFQAKKQPKLGSNTHVLLKVSQRV